MKRNNSNKNDDMALSINGSKSKTKRLSRRFDYNFENFKYLKLVDNLF